MRASLSASAKRHSGQNGVARNENKPKRLHSRSGADQSREWEGKMQQIAILMWMIVIGFVSLGSVVLLALATIKRELAQRDQQLQEHLSDLKAIRSILERAWSVSRAKDATWR